MSPKLENIKTYMTYIVKILENTSMQVNQITQTCAITTNFKLPKPLTVSKNVMQRYRLRLFLHTRLPIL